MPTLLGMLGYDKPIFSFGRDLFDQSTQSKGVIYSNGTFNMVSDSLVVMFDETKVVGAYNYITDPMLSNDISSQLTDEQMSVEFIKAYIQQYYRYVNQRNFTANQTTQK